MKPIKNYLYLFIPASMVLIAIVSGCKKNDTKPTQTAEQEKQNAIKAIREKYGNASAPQMYPVNRKAEGGFYINKNGEETPINGEETSVINQRSSRTQTCSYDCNTAGDPGDLDITYTASYIQRFFYCGSTTGSEVTATWNISVPYTVLGQSPYNSALKSKGRMRFKSPGGTVLITNTNLQPFKITALGSDPACATNFLYRVTYTWSNVADGYFSNGNTLEVSLFHYSDCDLMNNNYLTSWVAAVVYPGSGTYAQPCSRIDKVWVNPSSGPNNCATAAGAYVLCSSLPPGFTATTDQQVEYRRRTNANSFIWTDQDNTIPVSTVYNGTIPGVGASSKISACCGVLWLDEMFTGNNAPNGWLVRYRNRHSGCDAAPLVTNPPALWTNGTYMTEYWAIF